MHVFTEALFRGCMVGMRSDSLKCDSCLEWKRNKNGTDRLQKTQRLVSVIFEAMRKSPFTFKCIPADSCPLQIYTTPFFLEQVDGKSLSSTFTEGRLHFILQKKERLAPEHSLDGPGVMSVFTGRPAANTQHNVQTCWGNKQSFCIKANQLRAKHPNQEEEQNLSS